MESERVCVYDIVLNGEVVYVGMTKNPKIRYYQHRTAGTCPDGGALVVHKWYEHRMDASAAERERQRELMPAFCNDLAFPPRMPNRSLEYEAQSQRTYEACKGITMEQVDEYIRKTNETRAQSMVWLDEWLRANHGA